MKWLELSIQTPPEYVEPLSQIFHRYGQGGVAMEEAGGFNPDEGEEPPPLGLVTLRTYLPLNASAEERFHRIDLGVRLISQVCDLPPLQQQVLEEEEWENSWKKHFQVTYIGRSIVLRPLWREYQPQKGEVVIDLDPGMAFGTGQHPTTRMCLLEIEDLLKPGIRMLDVGTGSGILSIAAAKLGAGRVVALDVDSTSVRVARRNVRSNGVRRLVHVFQGSLPYPKIQPGTFDLALANISAKVISQMADALRETLRPQGMLVASGIILENQGGVENSLTEAGFQISKFIYDGDWVTFVASLQGKS